MTIVAHLAVGGVHSLIGDLLISSLENPGVLVNIPAARNINARFISTRRFIVGLQQKVVILNKNLAVAWSGSFPQAHELFATLEPMRNLTSIDPEYVETVIENVDSSQKDRLSLIAVVVAGSDAKLITHHVSPPQDFDPVRYVACAGTGAHIFQEILRQQANNAGRINPNVSLDQIGSGFDLNLISAMHSEEFSSTRGIQAGWGGGFELARYGNDGIKKISDILSLYFFLQRDGNILTLFWLPNFRHTSYWDNLTIVQGIEHEAHQPTAVLPGRRDVFVVGPPGQSGPDLSHFSPPDIERQDVVLVSIEGPDGDEVVTVPSFCNQPTLRYRAPANSSEVEMSFDPEFIDSIVEGARLHWGKPVTFAGYSNRSR